MSGEKVEKNRNVEKEPEMVDVSTVLAMIKKAKSEGTLFIGSKNIKKHIKTGDIHAVIYSSSCPQHIANELAGLSKLSNIKLVGFENNSSALGEVCGKPFNVSVAGIKTKERPARK